MLFLDLRTSYLSSARTVLSTAVYPLQVLVDVPEALFNWSAESISSRTTLLRENQKLREQQLIQNAKLQRMASLQAENERIRALLQSAESRQEEVLIAEILSVELDPYKHQILVNKGRNHGVYVGQPLIDAWGVAGQITQVGAISSVATLITDGSHAVPVAVNRNGLRTIMRGTGQAHRLELPFITNNADIQAGDLLVTSGMGQRFPAGYPVAVITGVDHQPGAEFATVSARPTGHLERGRQILLVWYNRPIFKAESAVETATSAADTEAVDATPESSPTAEEQNNDPAD